MQNKLVSICQKVRKKVEKLSRKVDFSDKSLSCLCGVASGYLFLALQKAGIKAKIAVSEIHAFLLVEDQIVDITASQFGKEDICIIDAKTAIEDFWEIEFVFKTLRGFINHQREWPTEQRYENYEQDRIPQPT